MGFIVLMGVFQYCIALVIAHFFNFDESITVRSFAVIFLVLSFMLLLSKNKFSRERSKMAFFLSAFYIAILLGLCLTFFVYGELPDMMRAYFLTFGTRCLTGLVLALAIAKNKAILKKVEKSLQPFCIILTLLLLVITIQNKSRSYLDYDFSRQTLSYAGAYSFALLLLVNFNFSSIEKYPLFSHGIWKVVNVLLCIADLYVVIAGGGGGAFVLTSAALLYFLFFGTRKRINRIVGLSALLLVLVIAISVFSTFTPTSAGFQRIFEIFSSGFQTRSSIERIALYEKVIEFSKSNFFLGGGAGSTAYTIGFYSHNIFMDILADFGLIGMVFAFMVVLLVAFTAFSRRYRYSDKGVQFFFIVFLCGFVMLSFSSTWLSNAELWFGVSSMLLLRCDKERPLASRTMLQFSQCGVLANECFGFDE